MKDFNNYLGNFNEMNLWDQVFPGSNINTKLVKSNDFVVVIANLFRNEPLNRLETKLVQEYKIEGDVANKVVFLLSLKDLTPENAPDFYKKKVQCAIKDETILEWYKVSSIDDPVMIKFLEYRPSVDSKELMAKGFSGRELGLEIRRLVIENFKKML